MELIRRASGLFAPRRFEDHEPVAAHGHFTFTTRDADTGQIHEEVEADNLIVNNGLTLLAGALIYNCVVNQNKGWGLPVPAVYGNLGNVYGALGTGSTTPTANDVALANEIGRALVVNAAVIGTANAEIDFFFGTAQANGAVREYGMFCYAYLNTTTLTTGLVNATNYTSLSVSPFLVTINGGTLPTGTILEIDYGATTPTQYCKLSAPAASGATTLSITNVAGGTFTANSAYAIGTTIAVGPNGSGVTQPTVIQDNMFDHAVGVSAVTKNSKETATLGLQLAFTSM